LRLLSCGLRVRFPELSYANADDPPLKRNLVHLLERLAGRDYFAPLYEQWRSETVPSGRPIVRPMLGLLDVELEIRASQWPPQLAPDRPILLIANHPFGIIDGIGAMTLAEDLGRPFKVLINMELMKVPELRPYSLPIDFRETRAAQATNLRTRNEAIRELREGSTVIVFPAGGVATAPTPFARAVELPWKSSTTRLLQSTRASVLPVYFEGQCGPLFHLASRVSMTLRLSMLIREFRLGVGGRLVAHVGDVVPFEALKSGGDRKALIGELYELVHGLAPPNEMLSIAAERRSPSLRSGGETLRRHVPEKPERDQPKASEPNLPLDPECQE
jgi:putative hemolysin